MNKLASTLALVGALSGCATGPGLKKEHGPVPHNASVNLCTGLVRKMLTTKMEGMNTISVVLENPTDPGHKPVEHPGVSRITANHWDGESASCLFNPAIPYEVALRIA